MSDVLKALGRMAAEDEKSAEAPPPEPFTAAAPRVTVSVESVTCVSNTEPSGRTVAMERSVEYIGEATRHFTTDMRFTIANMTAEFGGLNGIFEADATVAHWLHMHRRSHKDAARYFQADADASYLDRFVIDLANMEPKVAKPFSPDNCFNVSEVAGMEFHGGFIGACTTTEEELVLGGMLLERMLADGLTPVPTRNRLVVPGDLDIQARLREAGLLSAYERAGFRIGPPGCSMCLGVASERAAEGEVWLTSQNRNYENRMGKGSFAWLASAATVAVSAPGLKVADPRPVLAQLDQDRYRRILRRDLDVHVPAVESVEPTPVASASFRLVCRRARYRRSR
jgi:aconitate hydratase/homoaconitate hydratase